MQWREVSKSKVEKLKDEKLNMEDKSFKPTIYSVPMKDFEGKAKDLTIKQGSNHISRQIKARKDKLEQEKKLNWTGSIKTSKVKTSTSTPSDGEIDEVKHANNTEDLNHGSNELGMYDEHIVELLERERKEWYLSYYVISLNSTHYSLLFRQKERSKLIHCIHLQQIELTERTSAGN